MTHPNPERDERLAQIRERHANGRTHLPNGCEDIDYLLSLLDSQSECFDRGYLGGSLQGHADGYELGHHDAATRMRDRCVEKVREAGQWCDNCPHRAAPANADGSCSAYGYNGIDCQAQPCRCRSHNPESQHYGMLITALQSLTLEGEQEK